MPPPFVYPLRVGDSTGALVPGSLALLLGPGLSVTYDPDVVCTGNGASITGAVRVALAVAGVPIHTTDGTTASTLFSVAIPTGEDCAVEFTIYARITGGSGVMGHTGQRICGRIALVLINPSGTPSINGGASLSPSEGAIWTYDETSGFLSPALSAAYAANLATVQITGKANVNITWGACLHSAILFSE